MPDTCIVPQPPDPEPDVPGPEPEEPFPPDPNPAASPGARPGRER